MKKNIFCLAMLLIGMMGCVKEDFDRPSPYEDPTDLKANQTILGLKQAFMKHFDSTRQNVMAINEDWVISAIVTADDQSQNFYKEIVIDDTTAGIGVLIDQYSLYNDFPIGRRVFIKLKGMSIGQTNGLIQLGGYIDSVSRPGSRTLGRVVSTNIRKHIVKGTLKPNQVIKPISLTINQINSSHQYRLLQLNSLEFICNELGSTYADAINLNDASRTLSDGKGKTIILRSSGYSVFAGKKIPNLNGTVVGIYTVYNNDRQLKIRDEKDLMMSDQRIEACEAGPPITIRELRNLYKGTNLTLKAVAIEGVVTSDQSGGNIDGKNLIIQDSTAGIMIRFVSAHGYRVGDKIRINLRSGSLEQYSSWLQVNNTPLGTNVELLAQNVPVTPRIATIAEINANFANWESMLVKIQSAQITGTGSSASVYSGSKSLKQGSNSLTLYTSSAAKFAGLKYPTGDVDVVGYLGIYNTTRQIQIRTENDVTAGTTGGGTGGGGATTATPMPIDSLRMLFKGTAISSLTNDRFIEGVVISDRTTSNIDLKNMVIQDQTGGILVRFTANHSYNIGDKVKVNIKGFALEEYKSLLQLNNVTLSSTSKSGTGTITPRSATVKEVLNNNKKWESSLVKLTNVTISGSPSTYAGSKLILQSGDTITLYTLNNASFASQSLPTGTADIVGYVSIYNNTKQLIIRSLNDVTSMGGGGGGTLNPIPLPIDSLRMMNLGTISSNRFIEGIVISDRAAVNTDTKNIVIQEASNKSGILVRFTAVHSFNLGDKVKIEINGSTYQEYFNLKQLNNVANAKATKTGTGTITPRVATIPQIKANFNQWESTLVTIDNVSFPAGTYKGTKMVSVGSDSIAMYTRDAATFANTTMPTTPKKVTAILTQYTTTSTPNYQITLRNLNDLQ